ncbi:MAG: hypothetical protein WDM77_01680 [Steroidobacteraceae bacterium]
MSNNVYSDIGAYSTVPLPLPAILLLSGIAGLATQIRRRQLTVA